ncbi:MAG: permease-like cell division protein FtsX [Oscillospiraceae bacterium]|nr:permease-like cell division protein FtsX [Oscillospiraceae bacterium]MDD3832471.1 permease-like cell division protein FtsX [Oscillospiraceae bacterium]MDD4546421.1 permease-like cell division protein FtsX [Oscillospiraceae bacterium]
MVLIMSLSSLRYLIREGFRNIWQNRFMAFASIGVLISCLLLTGASYLFFVNIDHSFEWVYGQNVVVAFAKEDCTDQQSKVLLDKIKGITNVEDVEFVSKELSLLKYKDTMPKSVYEDMQGENNPYLDAYVITFSDLNTFKETLTQIEQIPEVDSTAYNEDIAKTLTRLRRIVLMVSGSIVLVLLVVSLFIIANTIKLTVYSRRLEISIMKSVGATNMFVRIPFIIEGVVLGIVSGLLSFGLIKIIYDKLSEMAGTGIMGGLVDFSEVWHFVLFGFLVMGTVTGMIGSAISMGKYLKDEGGISSVI